MQLNFAISKHFIHILFSFFIATVFLVACGRVSETEYENAELKGDAKAVDEIIADIDCGMLESERRNSDWARDILTFRRVLFMNHPLLSSRAVTHITHEIYASYAQDFSYAGRTVFYNSNLREKIGRELDILTQRIPELRDADIIFELSRIMALLGDSHTWINFFPSAVGAHYPLNITYVYDGFYIFHILVEYKHLINSRVVAINGVYIEEILERLAKVIPHESGVRVRYFSPDALTSSNFLRYLGILCDYDDAVEYSLKSEDGELVVLSFTHPISVMEWGEFMQVYGIHRRERDMMTDNRLMQRNLELSYWNKWIADYNMMYVRYSRSVEMEALPFRQFVEDVSYEVRSLIAKGERIERFVIDVRGNSGGSLTPHFYEIARLLNQAPIENVYILINHLTMSAGVITAVLLRDMVDVAIIVGEPAGQGPNFFAAAEIRSLSVSGATFRVSTVFFESKPSYEWDSLMPDIYIRRTKEDHFNDRDTVLEAIKVW